MVSALKLRTIVSHSCKRGKVVGTGGTHINCVTRHILVHKVRRVVVITDGDVGNIPGEHLRALKEKRVRIHSVLTSGGALDYAEDFRGKRWELPC